MQGRLRKYIKFVLRITILYQLKENIWGYDKAFHVLRCVSLHLNLRACFSSCDLFYFSVRSRQCALISLHCSDVICVGWALLNDLPYWILWILNFCKVFVDLSLRSVLCSLVITQETIFCEEEKIHHTFGPKKYISRWCYFCILMFLMFQFELRSS